MSANRQIRLHKRLWVLLWHWWRGGIHSSYTKVWTSMDGRQTPICYLDDKHLRNILKLLMRRQAEAEYRFLTVAPPQGEMAMLAYEEEMATRDIWNSKPRHPLWQDLVNEANLRGITWYNEKRGD